MQETGEVLKQNKMGVMPIGKLLFTMALPIIISMLVQALYNIVDSMFVAKISEDALTAVSLAFPIQNIIIAVAVGTGVGVNALLSKFLGMREFDKANKVASNSILLALVNFVVIALIGGLGAKFYFSIQTDIESIITMGTDYTVIVCVCSLGVFFQITYERLLQATGKTVACMIMQLMGAITNIVLDPILIFGLLGMPAMGVKGAAIATVIGQTVAMIVGFFLNTFHNKEIRIRFKEMLPDFKLLKEVYRVAIPSMLMSSVMSVTIFGFNQILLAFNTQTSMMGNTAAAFLGVYFKLQSFVFMPAFGLNSGMIPIVAYNYGAKSKDRIDRTVKLAIIASTGIMLAGFIIVQAIPRQLLAIFDASDEMYAIGIVGLRIISSSFLLVGFNIVMSGFFQALGNGMYSFIMSALRQIVIALPMAWLLSKTGKIENIWWSLTIAEALTLFVSIFFLVRINKKVKKNCMPDDNKANDDNANVVENIA